LTWFERQEVAPDERELLDTPAVPANRNGEPGGDLVEAAARLGRRGDPDPLTARGGGSSTGGA